MVEILNIRILKKTSPDVLFDAIKLSKLLTKHLSLDKDINIIFVESQYIKKLNKEYRSKDEITDVLSFNIDTDTTLGEIYICPEYIQKNISKEKFLEEILRMIIHGILHLKGVIINKNSQNLILKAN
jgi:rRNA maturation RNase YbeY